MNDSTLKDLLFGHLKEEIDANVLQVRYKRRLIQARDRSARSDDLVYTPFEEVRDQACNKN